MPAKVKETVLGTDLLDPQDALPQLGQRPFHGAFGGDKVAVQIGPLKALTAAATRPGFDHPGLGPERHEIERRHINLGRAGLERPAERLAALIGRDAARHVVDQPRLGPAQRGMGLRAAAQVAGRQLRQGKSALRLQPPHLEIPDLDIDLAVFAAKRDVKPRHVGAGTLAQHHMADDTLRQVPPDADRRIGHGHPQMVGRIAGHQPDGPAGGDIKKRRMQAIALGKVPARCLGQAQMRNALPVAHRRARDHVPARPELQMRLLRRAERHVERPPAAPRDCAGVDATGPCAGIERGQNRLGGRDLTAPALGLGGTAQREMQPVAISAQRDLDLARARNGHRAQEYQVANFKGRANAPRRQRLRGQLHRPGSGQDHLTRSRPVLAHHPVARAVQLAEKHLLGPVLCPRLAQQRQIEPHTLLLACSGPRGHRIGGHARFGPDPPVQRHDPRCAAGTRPRIGVEIGIGGDIIDLPRRGDRGRGRGKEHHQLQRAIREHLFEHTQPGDLGRQHRLHSRRILGQDRRIVDMARRVQHTCHGTELAPQLPGHLLHRQHIRDIALHHPQRAAQRLDLATGAQGRGHRPRPARAVQIIIPGLARRQTLARHQCDIGAVVARQHPRDAQAHSAQTAGDEIGPARAQHGALALGLGQCHGLQPRLQPPPVAMGRAQVRRLGQHILDQRIGPAFSQFARQPPARGPQIGGQVHMRHADAGKFARDHTHRPRDRGLLGPAQRLIRDLRRAVGKDREVTGLGHLDPAHRLRQIDEAEKAMLHVAVKETAAGAETLARRHTPEMRDPLGQRALPGQRGHQRVIPVAPHFGGQHIRVLAPAQETVARCHRGHAVPHGAQPLDQWRGQPGLVDKDKP